MLPSATVHDQVKSLYGNHHAWVVQILRRKLGNHHQAMDLAQDTFVRLLRQEQLPTIAEPRAYLRTLASRLCGEHFRRQALELAYVRSLSLTPAAEVPSEETRLLVIEALETVGSVLDGLGSKVREVFLLSQLDGLTYPQIAEQLGLTVNMVQKAMLKAYRHCYAAVYLA
ncbi:sigma-70 family RNA polymerase sigma factor [Pseudomonas eucalypticola]|uniref:Sigma-70 family RNA polymerase sigma factor n=1 Tax=Pseudomonas eucalypticola TaxID=2599595 RepID=A0A7D5HLE9_9PSED|nr:sigma-70 family RNA polymerase sigma factor [Pseudomonas eucalypticola]QKZ02928.1 sigma-70 family RNA polymerase sigma factor [Pseudomonas eucalypticola]